MHQASPEMAFLWAAQSTQDSTCVMYVPDFLCRFIFRKCLIWNSCVKRTEHSQVSNLHNYDGHHKSGIWKVANKSLECSIITSWLTKSELYRWQTEKINGKPHFKHLSSSATVLIGTQPGYASSYQWIILKANLLRIKSSTCNINVLLVWRWWGFLL